jgi:hypothetical protein
MRPLAGSLGGVAREGLVVVDDKVRFAADLYRGSAVCYDRYRLPYPEAMLTDLVLRAEVSQDARSLLLHDPGRRRPPR